MGRGDCNHRDGRELPHNEMGHLIQGRRDEDGQFSFGNFAADEVNRFLERMGHRVAAHVAAQFRGRHFFSILAQLLQRRCGAALCDLACERIAVQAYLMNVKVKHDVIPQLA